MIIDAARRIANIASASSRLPLGRPDFRPKDRYRSKEFDPKNFREIQDSHTRGLKQGLKLASLDGGNLPILKTPSFAVHFERIYFNCFKENERVNLKVPNKLEFFVVVISKGEKDIKYETRFVPLNPDYSKYLPDEKDLIIDTYDETMKTGNERLEIPRVGDVARSFAEWNYAKYVVDELNDGDTFIRDGTLHAPYTNQTAYAEEAYKAAKKNGVLFCGVSKTSYLYTTSGLPLVSAVSRLARDSGVSPPWYYENIVDITDPAHKADLNFAKLNANSDYVFRIEVLRGQEGQKENIMSALSQNSNDISFPGYPYGLVDADKNARVSYSELDALRVLLLSEISKTGDFDSFMEALKSSEAHEWLNLVV